VIDGIRFETSDGADGELPHWESCQRAFELVAHEKPPKGPAIEKTSMEKTR
jgi:hypothetical protein